MCVRALTVCVCVCVFRAAADTGTATGISALQNDTNAPYKS